MPLIVVSTLFLLAFREPRLHERSDSPSLRRHIGDAVDTVRAQPRLLPIVALLVVTSLLSQAIFEFGPLWLVELDAGAGFYGPAWALLMTSLGLGGAIASRVRLDRPLARTVVTGLLGAAAATLLVSRNVVVVTVAQVVLATFAVAVGVLATRLLHDSIPSVVRSSVASGVGAATWLTFLPLALVFGAVADRLGVHAAGWLLAAATAAAVVLLVTVTRKPEPEVAQDTIEVAAAPLGRAA